MSFTEHMQCAQALAAQGQWGARTSWAWERPKTPWLFWVFALSSSRAAACGISEIVTKHLPSLAGRKQTCDTFLAWHQCYSLLENSSSFVPHFSEMEESWKISSSSSCSEGKRSEVSIFRISCTLKSSDTQDIPSSLLIKQLQLEVPQLKQQPPSQERAPLYIAINGWHVFITVIYGFAWVIILMLM